MKKKKLFPIGISKKVKDAIKNVVFFIILVLFIFTIVFLAAALTGCNSQDIRATTSQEEMIFELKCKLENQQKLVRAYQKVLHEVWLDKPNYVEEALAEGDAFIELEEIMGDTDVFKLCNASDSARYNYEWLHEGD